MSVTAVGITKIPTITRNWWRIEMENNHVFIDYDEGKVLLCENDTVVTTLYCYNWNLEEVFNVLKKIINDIPLIEAIDIKNMNAEKNVVRVASAFGSDIDEVFRKAFRNMRILKNVIAILQIDDQFTDTVIKCSQIFDDQALFDKDGTLIWKLEETHRSGKNAYLTAVIFS